ncbi:MAG: hypothetical protein KGH72_06110, partial [Candidatus Micrarchaeota archaeon]|nr:hypothetical protein [Candidatus Micrarchaeota archaeon]
MAGKSAGIIWFKDRRCLNSRLVGNKGANLAKLQSLGYNVPDGFCIAANAAVRITENPQELNKALKHLGFPVAVRS